MVKRETLIVTQNTLNGDIQKEYIILIGENAKDNTELVKESEPDDIWFHLEKESSPHIILKSNFTNEIFEQEYLKQVASKLYKFKIKHNCDNVIYTRIKNVKTTKTPGLVETSNTTVIKYNKLKNYLH